MHEKALPEGSLAILEKMEQVKSSCLNDWILADGTGLALHLGHRISEDLDFFRTTGFDINEMHNLFKEIGPYETLQEAEHTITVILNNVKLSFFYITDPFIFNAMPYRFFSIADVRDISLMKLVAISGRGSRKDFIDLFTILRSGPSLQDYFNLLPQKYDKGRTNIYHILKSLTYFDDAENEPMPKMLEPFDWQECKNFFIREAHSIVMPNS